MLKLQIKQLIFLFVITMLVSFCEKKIFHSVKITGRLLHFYTGTPVACNVNIVTDNKFSGSSQSVEIGDTKSDSNGFFTIKGRASKAPTYYLRISEDNSDPRIIEVKEDKTTDLGDLLTGSQIFYCKVTLIPVGQKCIHIYNNNMDVAAGTFTNFVCSLSKSWKDTFSSFSVDYTRMDCNTPWQTQSAIFSSKTAFSGIDTLNCTIQY